MEPVKVSVGIRATEEECSVNDDELLEWARCHQKEGIRDIQFGVNLTEDQQKEMMKILETYNYKRVFTDVPGKFNLIEHRIILNNEDPVRSKRIHYLMLFEKNEKEKLKTCYSWE